MINKVKTFRSNDIYQLEEDINDFIYKVTESYENAGETEVRKVKITTIESKEVIDIKYQATGTTGYTVDYSALMIYRELG